MKTKCPHCDHLERASLASNAPLDAWYFGRCQHCDRGYYSNSAGESQKDLPKAAADAVSQPAAGVQRCAATRGFDPPQDCDAPFCGCNPQWSIALDEARKSGWLTASEAREHKADAARLDNLPQCFHMLRLRDGQWHLTYAPNNVYASVRDAIDAHTEPDPRPHTVEAPTQHATLKQFFSGIEFGTLAVESLPKPGHVLSFDGRRLLVHHVKHVLEIGVEDITPSGGCGG